jgi:hypothetical protein
MPFDLMNAGETFQHVMDIAFIGEKDKFVVIYLDDITMFSKSNQEHYQHLEKLFMKLKMYGLSLNPNKSLFSMNEGKVLGNIILVGVNIDPNRVKAIKIISLPRFKK